MLNIQTTQYNRISKFFEQGASKMFTVVRYHKRFYVTYMTMLRMFMDANESYDRILNTWMKRTAFFGKMLCMLYTWNIVMFLLIPVVQYAFFNEKVLVLNLMLPLIKIDTYWGYTINTVYQCFVTVLSGFGLLVLDLVFLIYCLMAAAMLDLNIDKCQNFDAHQISKNGKSTVNVYLGELVTDISETWK